MTATNADTLFQQLSDFVQEGMKRLNVPGVGLGIQFDGREFVAGFGVTSVPNPLPVTPDTTFQIGSITKTFTASAAMRLVEQGKLDLDAPIRTYLPDLKLSSEEATTSATLRHIFNHTGGWVGDYFDDCGPGDDARARIVERMAKLPQLYPFGQLFSYNNSGYYIAGRVLEVVTGKSYEHVIHELIFEPLGMDHSFFDPEEVMLGRFAVGHNVIDGEPQVARPWGLTRATFPAGAISSSVRDQLTYARFQMGDGTASNGDRVLQRSSMDEMQAPRTPAGSGAGHVGVSWMIKDIDGVRTLGHTGGTNGQISLFRLVPSKGFAISVLTNANQGSELYGDVLSWALEHYLDLKETYPPEVQPGEDTLKEYAGSYTAALSDAELYVENGVLMLQATPKGGFPMPDSKPGPKPPPVRLSIHEGEQIVSLDAPFKASRGEFLRGDDGSIEWMRFGSRLARRVN
ncbi:MAG: serine hydrolase domain-containing protein [Nitrolancea sp.]